MTGFLSRVFLSSASRKIIVYYIAYTLLFLLFYLALASTISFFHFLLDHDLGVIEAWLNRNGWEVVILAKAGAAAAALKALKLNNYLLKDTAELLRTSEFVPRRHVVAVCAFLPVFFTALARQFEPGLLPNPDSEFASVSYFGSALFYLTDLFVLYSAAANFSVEKKRQALLLGLALPLIFFLSSSAALPFLERQGFFLVAHFAGMLLFVLKDKNNLGNLLLYVFLVAAPMASVFGADPLWGDSRSLFRWPSTVPVPGIWAIWLTGFIYYLRRSVRLTSPA